MYYKEGLRRRRLRGGRAGHRAPIAVDQDSPATTTPRLERP